jgi:AAA+ ATPase superfamily predicted ATPase
MFFVGRERETHEIIGLIEGNKNVILTGKFGIGRTALVRHIAAINQNQWRFVMVDFSLSPAQAEQAILPKWVSSIKPGKGLRPYKPGRLLNDHLDHKGKPWVVVLDNIARLSTQKRAFIHRLKEEERFRFIAIAETFLPERDLFLLRKELIPGQVITLQYLSVKDGYRLFRYLSEKYHLHWPDNRIKMLASATQGYPLGIKEIVYKEVERSGRR